jgi:hypothetical protein
VVLAALGGGLACGASGPGASTELEAAQRGGITYRRYCANCHGPTGRGDGKLAQLLRRRPADLTQLQERNGGVFAADAVARAIDGRQTVKGHGARDMPVWGVAFQEPGPQDDQEPEIRERLDHLVAYLESLQPPGK